MAAAAPPNVQFGIDKMNSFDDSNSDDQSWTRALFEAHGALIPIGRHTCKAEFPGQRLCACTPSDFRFWIKSVRTPLPADCHGFLYRQVGKLTLSFQLVQGQVWAACMSCCLA